MIITGIDIVTKLIKIWGVNYRGGGSSKLSDSCQGGLATAFSNFRAVLRVNIFLTHSFVAGMASSCWPCDLYRES